MSGEMTMIRHKGYMLLTVLEARDAEERGERPFGCLIVDDWDGSIIATASGTHTPEDATRHSEIVAIQQACMQKGPQGKDLSNCTLYSTHEPCPMCCGAINHAKVGTVVWGSRREDLPALFRQRDISVFSLLADTSHPPIAIPDVLRKECVHLFDRELQRIPS